MTTDLFFSHIVQEAEDPILAIVNKHAADPHPDKIDASIGVYKTEDGDSSYVFPSVKRAKAVLAANDPGHCYTYMQGIPEYLHEARKTVFGAGAGEGRVSSLHTPGGTGALHFATTFLVKAGYKDFYVGTPAWGNYHGIVESSGGNFHEYNHYNRAANDVDFVSCEQALRSAPAKSVFILQACCHNPTGADFTNEQWHAIAQLARERNLLLLLDSAYLGFASGTIDGDAYGVRYLLSQGLEFVVCQSYSKNLALYSERVGAVHVVVKQQDDLAKVSSLLVAIFRSEASFASAFGARVATIVQSDPELSLVWKDDVKAVHDRLKLVRQQVYDKLVKQQTPGQWDHVLKQRGLFWFSGLSKDQVTKMIDEQHVYMTFNGRVNMASLNQSNIDRFCAAIHEVVTHN